MQIATGGAFVCPRDSILATHGRMQIATGRYYHSRHSGGLATHGRMQIATFFAALRSGEPTWQPTGACKLQPQKWGFGTKNLLVFGHFSQNGQIRTGFCSLIIYCRHHFNVKQRTLTVWDMPCPYEILCSLQVRTGFYAKTAEVLFPVILDTCYFRVVQPLEVLKRRVT